MTEPPNEKPAANVPARGLQQRAGTEVPSLHP